MRFFKLYGLFIKLQLKSQMEYAVSFITGMFANFYCYLITFATFWVIIDNFGDIDGWNFSEMSILYALRLLTYAIAGVLFWRTTFQLEKQITQGNLDMYLTRPMGILQQLVCKEFGYTFIGQIIVTVVFIILAIADLSARISILTYIYWVFAIIGGVLINGAAMIFFGTISFWTLRSNRISGTLYYDLMRFVEYPLSIYSPAIRVILTYIFPWAIINYYPSLIILNKVETLEQLIIGILSPAIGLLLFWGATIFFNYGLKQYSGTGS